MANLKTLLTAILGLLASHAFGQNFFNRPVPSQVPPYQFVQYDNTNHGYYLTAPFRLGPDINDTTGQYPKPAMILDANGYLIWYMPVYSQNLLDFKYLPEQQLFSLINYKNQHDIRFMLMDSDFLFVDSFTTSNGILPDLHDFQISAEQTFLLTGLRDSSIDLSNFYFNGVQGSANTKVIGFAVQEFNAQHQLLFQWNSNDHIHPTMAYGQYGYAPANFDYCHGNAIEEDLDGGLLLSFRNLNAIYKINRVTGQMEWSLGGKSSSFTFSNDAGFSGQHDIRRLPNGNISLFDNGNMAAPPKVSRAVEYSLDTVQWVATKVWEYKFDPGFLSVAMGNHQTTENRLHLVNYGLNFRPNPSFVLTNDAGEVLTKLFFQDNVVSYRSFLFDLPIDQLQRPVIACDQNGTGVTLSAPTGFDHYEWSTGENTATISVSQPGVYQVWVNQGNGMLGSEPIFIQDLNDACPVSETNTPLSTDNQRIMGYYDLLGREIELPEKGKVYVVRYANGVGRLGVY